MMDNEVLSDKLHTGLQFTKDDLFMNRQGMMTPSQIERAKHGIYFNPNIGAKIWIAFIFFTVIIFLTRNEWNGFSLETALMIVPIFLVYGWIYYLYSVRPRRQLQQGKLKVESLSGQVKLHYDEAVLNQSVPPGANKFVPSNYSPADFAYVVQVGEKKIYTTKSAYEAFENGRHYTLYFIRATKTEYNQIIYGAMILSAEVKEVSSDGYF